MQENAASVPDATDARLLRILQRNAELTAHQLGEMLHLSPSQAGRRRQRLEETGLVTGYHAVCDARRLGLGVQAFVQVIMASHQPDATRAFARLCDTTPGIVSAWTLTGEADFLLRVYCTDLDALHSLIHGVLLRHDSVARVHSQIVMDQLKPDAPLPI